jgi:antitoxin component YwqK of YwqJK toxin-antitoxin module
MKALVLAALFATILPLACGRREEIRTTRYADGHLWTEVHFARGKPEGSFTTWYRNGRKANEGANVAGRLDGKMTEWHDDGTVVLEASYRFGFLDGPWHERWPDGKDRCTAVYRNGLLDGPSVEWDRNGRKIREGGFVAGKREGKWTGISEKDGLPHTFEYVGGVLKSDLEKEKKFEAAPDSSGKQ